MKNVINILNTHLTKEQMSDLEKIPFISNIDAVTTYILNNKQSIEDGENLIAPFSQLIHHINHNTVSKMENGIKKIEFKKTVATICTTLIEDMTKEFSATTKIRIIKELDKAITYVEQEYEYDGRELRELLAIDKIIAKFEDKKTIQSLPMHYLRWVGNKDHLIKLANLLHKDYDCTRTVASFINVFSEDRKKRDLTRWRSEKLDHLIHLLHSLYEANYIACSTGKKEYFKIAEEWFIDFAKVKLKKDWRKRSWDIRKKPEQFETLHIDIQALIKDMQK